MATYGAGWLTYARFGMVSMLYSRVALVEERMVSGRMADSPAHGELAFGQRTLEQFGELLRAPEAHVGGASAAAASASLAAATAALVTTLSARRRRNLERKAAIEQGTRRLHELDRQLLAAGAEDESALSSLMSLYQAKPPGDPSALGVALQRAAESSIEIARLAAQVCLVVERQTGSASRFTVSDLGAAAAMARGAVTAALLTAQVNVVMLRDHPTIPKAAVERLASAIAEIDATSGELAGRAIDETRQRISPMEGESAR